LSLLIAQFSDYIDEKGTNICTQSEKSSDLFANLGDLLEETDYLRTKVLANKEETENTLYYDLEKSKNSSFVKFINQNVKAPLIFAKGCDEELVTLKFFLIHLM